MCRECRKFYDRLDTHLRYSHNMKNKAERDIEIEACKREETRFLSFHNSFPSMKHNNLPSTSLSTKTNTSIMPSSKRRSASSRKSSSTITRPSASHHNKLCSSPGSTSPDSSPTRSSLRPSGPSTRTSPRKTRKRASNDLASVPLNNVPVFQLEDYVEMTPNHHEQFGTDKRVQKYYFRNGKILLLNFKNWLTMCCRNSEKNAQEYYTHVKKVWTQLDPTLTTGLKTRLTPENLQDQWYNKFVRMIEEELNKPIHLQGNFYKPNTIAVKLNSIMKMLKFVIAKKIFYGLVVDEINQFREVITTLTNGLSGLISKRQQQQKQYKLDHLLTSRHFHHYGNTSFVQGVVSDLLDKETKYTQSKSFEARNVLLVLTCFTNGVRASNLMEMSIHDFKEGKWDDEFNAYILRNSNYKTSILYGDKIIVLSECLHKLFDLFIKRCRHFFVEKCVEKKKHDHQRKIFLSHVTHEVLNQAAITKAMSTSFRNTDVLKFEKLDPNISPTRVRIAMATEFANNKDIDFDVFATHFMKHKPSTSRKFYVQRYMQREAILMSLKCYDAFGIDENLKKAALAVRAKVKSGKTKPEVVREWMKENAKLFAKERGVTTKEMEDDDLEHELRKVEKDDSTEGLSLQRHMTEIFQDNKSVSSIFELQRDKNIKENQDFLKSIGLPVKRTKFSKSVDVEDRFSYLSEEENETDSNSSKQKSTKVHFDVENDSKTVEKIDESISTEVADNTKETVEKIDESISMEVADNTKETVEKIDESISTEVADNTKETVEKINESISTEVADNTKAVESMDSDSTEVVDNVKETGESKKSTEVVDNTKGKSLPRDYYDKRDFHVCKTSMPNRLHFLCLVYASKEIVKDAASKPKGGVRTEDYQSAIDSLIEWDRAKCLEEYGFQKVIREILKRLTEKVRRGTKKDKDGWASLVEEARQLYLYDQ
ncbi:uncharacterized protein [Clytia hemisphaerica]|uniref:uncharacterized protein isoform X2 n=1 Tax=Clytia hemisphaerica TaxID=252671 RepID=UPI0034D512CC